MLEQGVREVSGSEASLAECIADGSVPKPDLGDWNTWLVWRKGAGRRPKVSLGDRSSTSSRQESDLWKATMQRLYGADWRTQLEEAQLAAADAEDAAGAPSTRSPTVGDAPAVGGAGVARPPVAGGAPVTGGADGVGEASPAMSVAEASTERSLVPSAPGSPRSLRQTLLQEFHAAAETGDEYQQRMDLVAGQLESLGESVSNSERSKVVFA